MCVSERERESERACVCERGIKVSFFAEHHWRQCCSLQSKREIAASAASAEAESGAESKLLERHVSEAAAAAAFAAVDDADDDDVDDTDADAEATPCFEKRGLAASEALGAILL